MLLTCYVPVKRRRPGCEASRGRAGNSVVAKVQGKVRGADRQATANGVTDEINAELANVAAALADDDEFSDVPTLANHSIPEAAPSARDIAQDNGQDIAGAGAYRMVRPATSDRIDVHPTPSPDRPTPRRVVIGVTRK